MMPGRAVYLCANKRTPIGRFGGALADVRPDDLAAHVIRAVLQHSPSLDPSVIGEVVFGCANQAGEDNRNVARMASLLAGLPEEIPGMTVNRLCSSGLDAVACAARTVALGESDVVIAGGVESMSRAPFVLPKAADAWSRAAEIYDTTIGWRLVNPEMRRLYGVESMPETGENVAADFSVTREDQDAFALRSQQRTARADEAGILAEEIEAVEVPQKKSPPKRVERDEHPRPETTIGGLAQLPTPFRDVGTVTAGNAAGVNDGAAAMILASEDALAHHQLAPIARVTGFASAGVAPRVMGVGPTRAIKRLTARMAFGLENVDVIELNEAFASQALAVLRTLHIDDDDKRVNPNGGAIALGHPLGMSGARLAMTAARELRRRGGNRAIATMCVGVGQGTALCLEAV